MSRRRFTLALAGAFDGRIVNVADDSSLSIYEMAQAVGYECDPSAAPLTDPWRGQMDTTFARHLGFVPTVPTVRDAARRHLL